MGSNPFQDSSCSWGDPPRPGECAPYRFLETAIHELLAATVKYGSLATDIPWAPVSKPLSESRVSVVSTAGLSMRGDEPFDMETERKRPSWGDPTWRRLRSDVSTATIQAHHLHIETSHLLKDLDVCFPVPLLRVLQAEGVVGEVAPSHYSIMGFQGPDTRRLRHCAGHGRRERRSRAARPRLTPVPADGRSGRTRDRASRDPNGGPQLDLVVPAYCRHAPRSGDRVSNGARPGRRG